MAATHEKLLEMLDAASWREVALRHQLNDARIAVKHLEVEIARLKVALESSHRALQRANAYLPNGRCRICGHKEGHHDMDCRHYVGPLHHTWQWHSSENGTFGGFDYRCSCGGHVRVGGLAGIDPLPNGEKPACPNIQETWRGPELEPGAELIRCKWSFHPHQRNDECELIPPAKGP